MDPVMLLLIAAIVAAIILVEFNKQQKNKASDGTQVNADLQQQYLLKAAELKISVLEDIRKQYSGLGYTQQVEQELTQLTEAFTKGNIQLREFNIRLDTLLNKFDTGDLLAQAS